MFTAVLDKNLSQWHFITKSTLLGGSIRKERGKKERGESPKLWLLSCETALFIKLGFLVWGRRNKILIKS